VGFTDDIDRLLGRRYETTDLAMKVRVSAGQRAGTDLQSPDCGNGQGCEANIECARYLTMLSVSDEAETWNIGLVAGGILEPNIQSGRLHGEAVFWKVPSGASWRARSTNSMTTWSPIASSFPITVTAVDTAKRFHLRSPNPPSIK
jgi:hypothetical protein